MSLRRKLYFSLLYLTLLTALSLCLFSFGASSEESEAAPAASAVSGKTALFLGIDNASYSSDVILVGHIDRDGRTLKLLQIPRDTYTTEGKLNSIFAAACTKALNEGADRNTAFTEGAKSLCSFLLDAMGLSVDYYAVMTLADLGSLVDVIGGVPIDLPRDLDYEDPVQGLSIHLKKGKQILDGKAAQGLVRCRNAYPNADYGRLDAQKLFMTAFWKELKHGTTLPEIITFIRSAHRALLTNVSLKEAFSIGKSVLFAGNDALFFATLKGESFRQNGKWYEVLPKESLAKAALWMEATFPEAASQKAFGGDGTTLSLYLSTPQSPFTPQTE